MITLASVITVLTRSWWVIALFVVAVLGSTAFFTYTQTPVYRATATVLVGPEKKLAMTKDMVSSLRALQSRTTIATIAKIVSSRKIRGKVSEKLTLSAKQMRRYRIKARVVPDTNIINVSVEHQDPHLAAEMANIVTKQTKYYVERLYKIFDLNLLDPATVPSRPVHPQVSRNLSAGAMFGLLLGIGVAFLVSGLGQLKKDENQSR